MTAPPLQGRVAVLASAATLIIAPRTVSDPPGSLLAAVHIMNYGRNPIWLGGDANVTIATGFPLWNVHTDQLGMALVLRDNPNHGVWAIAGGSDQISPDDTRWFGEPWFGY